ncbi:hypothetical protein B0T17DRAFT_618069 [Bombardia bombarda]|uniref:Uncharacterized protein n=1 Tax=Bombardia bombarda TaxID=252184 RepID=A0AA39WUN0_9PEZI|nr:hypothetical protein B0T17DRAFT_618069 [Bombardia bombarda]
MAVTLVFDDVLGPEKLRESLEGLVKREGLPPSDQPSASATSTTAWQHVVFDALGMQYVVENWSAMLWGREPEIPTPCGLHSDPFNPLAEGTRLVTEPHVLPDQRVGLGGMLKWGLGYGVDMLVRAKENRMVCVPETCWRPQLGKALAELLAEALEKGEDVDKVFLTEKDVLVAASIAMSLRKAFEGDPIPTAAEHPYVGNAFGWANVLVRAGDVASKPLSWLAPQVRRAINEQGTRAQHEAYYAMVRESGMGLPIVIFGDGGMAQAGFSHWSKAGLFDLNFAPARKNVHVSRDVPFRLSYVQENHGPVKPVYGFFVFGKDARGNYRTSAYKLKGQ